MPTERERKESLWDKPGSHHYLKIKNEVMVSLSGDKWGDKVAQGHREEVR